MSDPYTWPSESTDAPPVENPTDMPDGEEIKTDAAPARASKPAVRNKLGKSEVRKIISRYELVAGLSIGQKTTAAKLLHCPDDAASITEASLAGALPRRTVKDLIGLRDAGVGADGVLAAIELSESGDRLQDVYTLALSLSGGQGKKLPGSVTKAARETVAAVSVLTGSDVDTAALLMKALA